MSSRSGEASADAVTRLEKVLEPLASFASKLKIGTFDPFVAWSRVESLIAQPAESPSISFNIAKDAKLEVALGKTSTVFAVKGKLHQEFKSDVFSEEAWSPLLEDSRLSEEEARRAKERVAERSLPVEALVKLGSPAPFGRDGETVFDDSVRKALEIPADRMPEGLVSALNYLVRNLCNRDEWESVMKPKGKAWRYQLYKMHMYGPGGKFEKHVDTLHQDNHVATFVVCLPSEHEGGTLEIEHLGKTVEANFSGKIHKAERYWNETLRYAVFYTDCAHRVHEVSKGWRIVVQFDVYEEEQQGRLAREGEEQVREHEDALEHGIHYLGLEAPPNEDALAGDPDYPDVVDAVKAFFSRPSDHSLGFFLRHRYSMPSLEILRLKGADRRLFDALAKKGFEVSVCGVVAHLYREEDPEPDLHLTPVFMDQFQIDSENSSDEEGQAKTTSSTSTDKRKAGDSETVDLILDEHMAKAVLLFEPPDTGNDPGEGYLVYHSACMIVRRGDAGKAKLAKLN